MSMSAKQRMYVQALTNQHPALAASFEYPITSRQAGEWIENVKVESLNRYGNRAGSMRAILSDLLVRKGLNVTSVYDSLTPLPKEFGYGDYVRRIEFSRNVDGKRVPKSLSVQHEELRKLLFDLRFELKRRESAWESKPKSQADTDMDTAVDLPSSPSEEFFSGEESEAAEEPENGSEENSTLVESKPLHPFLRTLRTVRTTETQRSEVEGKRTPILESVSGNRPAINAAKMLRQGIPTEALLHALALDWPEEARQRYGIKPYDVTQFTNGPVPENRHSAYAYVRKVMNARVPVALIGPAGTFKSTLCKQIAEDLGLDYGFVPMTAGATPGWIVGAYTLDGYRTRSAMECYQNGGVFVFEEMDAADPNMLLVANNLIENDIFDNPVTGEQLERNEDFIPVACMNTKALGATATNTGRNRLDGATRDRFAMGRVEIFLDEDLEQSIFESILNG